MPEIIPNLHPVFVHFTVALLLVATGLFVGLLLFKRHLPEVLVVQLRTVARWNLWIGAAITLITVAAGFYAYNTVAHDAPSHAAMTEHRNWALVTATAFIAIAVWSLVRVVKGKVLGAAFVVLLVLASGLLATTAWRGGEVVYRYGLGVMSLPKTDAHGHGNDGHAHAHDAAAEPMAVEGMDFSDMDFADEAKGARSGEDDHHEGDHAH